MSQITLLNSTQPGFKQQLDQLLAWEAVADTELQSTVDTILRAVRTQGDTALLDYTTRFDGWTPVTPQALILSDEHLHQAWETISTTQRTALQQAATRIQTYAERQKLTSWQDTEPDGTLIGQQITPLDRVGLYVPGGKAAYPSSVLMNALPAKVAGVAELIMVVPTPQGETNPLVLAAAHLCGVTQAFAIGGAQAIAALAYGTGTVPAVDKIVGPGNSYVAAAKRAVFGQVGIDMIAGPSEILVICDGQTNPDWIAMDLFSQAEHDEAAQAILVCPDADFIQQVQASITRLLPTLQRQSIVTTALRRRGALIQCRDLTEAATIANRIAPEHLELSIADPTNYVKQIRHAGAIFMGRYTSEPLGDYCAGPNHVLPTSGTARFSSPLGVYDFQKRTSLIMASPAGAQQLGRTASVLARGEGLEAHARAAEYRLEA